MHAVKLIPTAVNAESRLAPRDVSTKSPLASPAAVRLVALQRTAGNRAVSAAVQELNGMRSLQGPARVQRQDATAPTPAAIGPVRQTRLDTIAPLLEEWRSSGLLDPPFRPPDVPQIPDLPGAHSRAERVQPGVPPVVPGLVGPPPALAPPITPVPVLGPSQSPVPNIRPVPAVPPPPPLLVGIGIAIAILLWPSETAKPWEDMLSPITRGPYSGPDEYGWTGRLSDRQVDYLKYLAKARRLAPDSSTDGESDPHIGIDSTSLPNTRVNPRTRPAPTCFSAPVHRRGGHARHDAYATKVTGSMHDFYVRTPAGAGITYDGLRPPNVVWEVKVGFGWFFNPASAALTQLKLAEWDAQKSVGLGVAASCGYAHLWAHPDPHVARLVMLRWGGIPPVLNIPE